VKSSSLSVPRVSTLAIDIGGTKFSMAVFEGEQMVDRESHATDKSILDRIAIIIEKWKPRYRFDRCGIGFGGPVDFERQRVVLSTHVAGWNDFDLPGHLTSCSVLFRSWITMPTPARWAKRYTARGAVTGRCFT
jgi:hypothetical protein